jgi:kynureninase
MSDTLNRHREEFPTLASGIHLLSHSLGPIPIEARRSMLAYCDAWEHHTSEDAWATNWWELSQLVGDRIARIIGGAPGSVQVQPNASVALASAASCFNFAASKRNKVVTSELDFPSMEYFWEGQSTVGAKLEIVASPDGVTVPLENILAAIDETTALVALSHVSFRSSYRVDARAIVERAHSVGALVLLCGGPACGYLYVRPELQKDLRPRLTGWVAHNAPFEFAHSPMRYATSVRRFAQGTPSIPALYSVLPGLQIIEEVGMGTIAAESRRRTEWMMEHARERGWKINSPRDVNQRGGSVMIGVEDGPAMVEQLAARRVFVDCRPGVGLRLSPHFFNTDEEVNEALTTLNEALA